MARVLGLLPASLIAARGGLSANAFYRELRAQGLAARRSEVLALYKLSKSIVARGGEEVFRPITESPADEHLTPMPTRRATGIRQNVTLIYRHRQTGVISRTFYSVVSENGVIREHAMAEAINAYQDHAERYQQDLIGVVHTGSYRMMPMTFGETGLP